MRKTLGNYAYKFGVTTALKAPLGTAFPLIDADIYKSIDWLSENEFDSIEIHIPSPEMVDAPKLKEYLKKKQLEASSIGTGLAAVYEGLTLTSKDSSIREKAVERLKAQVDLGAYLGCPIIIGSMRGRIHQDETHAIIEERMLNSLSMLMPYAEASGVDVVIEAIDRSETNYLLTASDVLKLIELANSDRLKVHLDTFHMNIEETDWQAPVKACGNKLGHVHVADNTRAYPGSGMLDFKPFLKALCEVGYKGSLVFECFPNPDGYTACLLGREHLIKCIDELSNA